MQTFEDQIQRLKEQQALTILEATDEAIAGTMTIVIARDQYGRVIVREGPARFTGVSVRDALAQWLQCQKAPETLRSRDTLPVPPPLDPPSDAPDAMSPSQSPQEGASLGRS